MTAGEADRAIHNGCRIRALLRATGENIQMFALTSASGDVSRCVRVDASNVFDELVKRPPGEVSVPRVTLCVLSCDRQ